MTSRPRVLSTRDAWQARYLPGSDQIGP